MSKLIKLGYSQHNKATIFMGDFEWSCGWYWSGGCLSHRHGFYHLEHYMNQNVNMFDAIKADFGDSLALTDKQLWRFCDLMIQFYAYSKASKCTLLGGHMTSQGRTEDEINEPLGFALNKQIEVVIRNVRALATELAVTA